MNDPYLTKLARSAYQQYGAAVGNKNFRGEPMPEWNQLPEQIRHAWCEAAWAVRLDVLREQMADAGCACDGAQHVACGRRGGT